MIPDFLPRAIKESCPWCKETCDLKSCNLAGEEMCAPVALWFEDHKAINQYTWEYGRGEK
jgi:endo-beta-N-acetylglucosaminidase D